MKHLFVSILYATALVINCFAASSSIIVEPSGILLAETLFNSAIAGDTAQVRMLLKYLDPNACRCPVLGGVLARFIERSPVRKTIPVIFQMLLDADAEVNARNLTGGTVLHVLAACKIPNKIVFPCIYAVVDRGIDTTYTERIGDTYKTALHRARYFKHLAEDQRQPELVHRYGLRIAFMQSCNSDKELAQTVADFYSCSRQRVKHAFDKIVSWRSQDPTKFEQISQYLQES